MRGYRAFGLDIRSDFDLPYQEATLGRCDLTIRSGSVTAAPLHAIAVGALCKVHNESTWIDIPGVARYQVTSGSEITVEAMTDDAASVACFLANTAVGFALVSRKQLVLQAATVERAGHAVLLVGPAGHGRSALAAVLGQRDYGFLSDDLSVIEQRDGVAFVHGGGSVQRLWPDVLRHLQLDLAAARPLRPRLAKRMMPVEAPARGCLPIAGILGLRVLPQPAVDSHAIEASQKFTFLHGATFRERALRPLGLRQRHFEQLTLTAQQVPMVGISRPNTGNTLDAVADEADKIVTSWLS